MKPPFSKSRHTPPAPSNQLRLESAYNMRLRERIIRVKRPASALSIFSDSTVDSIDSSLTRDPDYIDTKLTIFKSIPKRPPRNLKRKAIAKNSALSKKQKTQNNMNICPSDPSPLITSQEKTAAWVASLPNSGTLVGVEKNDLEVTASETRQQTAPINGKAVSSPSTIDDNNLFKVPNLPVYRKKPKTDKNNCPTHLFRDLHELLNTQYDKKICCKVCKRCKLLTMYKKVSSKLPVSDDDEPDVLEATPLDVSEIDSDDEEFKFLRRGRELVRNVLTTKRLPIWLSNLKMNLKKTMFQDEHKLGTFKRTIKLNKDDVADTMVTKVIAKIEYLNRCLIEDNKELKTENYKQRLRSPKGAGSYTSKVLPLKRANVNRRSSPPLVRPSGNTEDISPPTGGLRPIVLKLIPLEVMIKQGALPANLKINGISM